MSAAMGSVDVRIGMGQSNSGRSAGHFSIYAETPYDIPADVESLRFYLMRDDVHAVRTEDDPPILRQVRAPEGLADIGSNESDEYSIAFYKAEDVGDLVKGLYEIVAEAQPVRTYVVQRVTGQGGYCVRILKYAGGSLEQQYDYVGGSNICGRSWTLELGDDTTVDRTETETWDALELYRTHTVEHHEDGGIVSSVHETSGP